ncbi:MAG: AAA family ATPase [Candidatus Dormibacteria bacterium]
MSDTPEIGVLLVDDIPSTLETLQKLLAFEDDIRVIAVARDGQEALEAARQHHPDVILMDVNMPVMDGIQATEVLVREEPRSPVIIMSVQGEREYLRRAMQAGAREFLIKPFSGDELVASIRRVHQLERKKEAFQAQAAPVVDDEEPGGVEAPPDPVGPQVVLVFSGKGGVGKSLVASNLAAGIAGETGARVALVDLDLQFGDLGVMLNLDAVHAITQLVEEQGGVDADFLETVMADGPQGIKVLLAPVSPELADLVTGDHIRHVFSMLRETFQVIVVDTSSHLGEATLEAIDHADRVVLLSTLSLPAIKEAKLALKILQSLNVAQEKILLVLNRSESHSDFNAASVENTLKFPISLQLPSDARLAMASIHRGVPIVTMSPESEFSQRIRELVGLVAPGVAAAAPQRQNRKRVFWAKASTG